MLSAGRLSSKRGRTIVLNLAVAVGIDNLDDLLQHVIGILHSCSKPSAESSPVVARAPSCHGSGQPTMIDPLHPSLQPLQVQLAQALRVKLPP